jgi:hypothetical protein
MSVLHGGRLSPSCPNWSRRTWLSGIVAAALLSLTACTSGPTGGPSPEATPAPSSILPTASPSSMLPTPSPSVPSVSPETAGLTIDVTIAGGKVSPSGKRYNVAKGTDVTLKVRSDIDDEIHAHTGGDGFALEVRAGRASTGRFTASSVGSFEIESHELEKVIAILNVR